MKSERKFKFKKRVYNVARVHRITVARRDHGGWPIQLSFHCRLKGMVISLRRLIKCIQEAELLKDQNILPKESSM